MSGSEVIIRRTEPSDAAALKKIFENEQSYSQTLQLPYPSLKLWSERLAATPDHIYSFVAQSGNEVVGNVSVMLERRARRRHVASIGMVVDEACAGKGIGKLLLAHATDLCDNWLGIRRIELTVFSDNERAIGLYRQFGFEQEGEARGFAIRNGRYENALYMARIVEPGSGH